MSTKCYACGQPAPTHTADCRAVAIDAALPADPVSPRFETPLASDEAFTIRDIASPVPLIARSWKRARTAWSHGLDVHRVRLVPVPAEATSGAEHAGQFVRDYLRTHAGSEYAAFGVMTDDNLRRKFPGLFWLAEHVIAALRTPPAPLPREGATVTERMVSHALIGAREEAMRRGVGMHLVAAERLTAALTPAAQPTTKTEK